ncbi:MAG: sodium:solute symporter [Pseudomonadota bacterium]
MTVLDWWVIAAYLVALLLLAAWLGRKQGSRRDYFLGGGTLPAPALAISILATQCSTNSLLGAPAFVGFALGGGLLWLQYELAVPLAMLVLAVLFPVIHRARPISIYAFLEERLGRRSRLLASACFLFFRGVATGITVYGVASVLALITDISYVTAVVLLMGVTVTYDVLGGMRAVVISDVLQMLLLVAAVVLALTQLGPVLIENAPAIGERTAPLLNDWGVDGSSDFGFWPMLLGGVFLYVAYYGFDQSQAQRLLAAHDGRALRQVLLLNGLLRFPLVFAYCVLGLGLAAYASTQPEFIAGLPLNASGDPNINLVFPHFVVQSFPTGLAGLAIVGLFAAAMSSIDSALNSLSASTMEDFLSSDASEEGLSFRRSKLITLAWGLFAVAFSFTVEFIADTILEAINKVGSLLNGPLLGLFVIALLARSVGEKRALAGFGAGLGTNLCAGLFFTQLSWLWWNVLGCLVTLIVALGFRARALEWPHVALPGLRGSALALGAGSALMFSMLVVLQLR